MSDNSQVNKITPRSNLSCGFRLTCNARVCPAHTDLTGKKPTCWIEKYHRYQPDTYNDIWYEKDWDELKKITWFDVLSLKESWLYSLIIIVVGVFIFFCMILIALYTKAL